MNENKKYSSIALVSLLCVCCIFVVYACVCVFHCVVLQCIVVPGLCPSKMNSKKEACRLVRTANCREQKSVVISFLFLFFSFPFVLIIRSDS